MALRQINMKHIVILGSGFGGIYAYKTLCRKLKRKHKTTKITIVSRDNFFLFSPMLHEVATGGLRATDVVQPIREIINCELDDYIQAEILEVDTKKQVVKIKDRGDIKYTELIIALGANAYYYNIPGAKEHTHALKTIADARKIRNRCLQLLQEASEEGKKVSPTKLRWIVVGAGPTGIELAAELAEYARDFAEKAPSLAIEKLDIQVHNANGKILPGFKDKIKRVAEKTLINHGIKLFNNSLIKKVTTNSIITENRTTESEFIIWTAGVEGVSLPINPKPEIVKGRLVVDEYLQLPNTNNVYVAGDMAYLENLPQTGQAAVAMGKYIGKNLALNKKSNVFKFKNRGMLLSLGQWKSAGNIGPIIVSGLFGWWLWRTIYLSKLLGVPNKIRTAIDWTIDIFYRRDIAEL